MYKNCVVKLLSLFLLVLSGLSYGDVDQGYEWLAGQQQADGQFSSAQGIATPQQETTESLLALLQKNNGVRSCNPACLGISLRNNNGVTTTIGSGLVILHV